MLKALIEKRNKLLDEADGIFKQCETGTETRALTDEENARLEAIRAEVDQINRTIEARSSFEGIEVPASQSEVAAMSTEESEIREFANTIRFAKSSEEKRDAANLTYDANGSIIPQSIANRIIKQVNDICPIFAGVTMFHVKGTLKIPVYGPDSDNNDITVGYAEDFTPLTANAGAFDSVDLTGYVYGALTLIGKQLLNSSDIDLVNFVVDYMAEKIAIHIEKELLIGTTGKCEGAVSTTNALVLSSTSVITPDDLIHLQATVKQAFQRNACWTMNPNTFVKIKTLKDGNGRYLVQDNITQSFPFMLLGKPVYLSDNMPDIAAGAKAILYGDYSGLAVNMRESINIDILRETYATQHAIGIYGYFEIDSKVMDAQKLAVLKMAAS